MDMAAVEIEPARRLFTIEEYERMAEAGILKDDDRVELIEGQIVEMSPIGTVHMAVVVNLTHILVKLVGEQARVWVQGPLRLPPRSLPQPDVAVLRPRSYMRVAATMEDAHLVIEVADTSLKYDSRNKLSLYARAGILEYWVVDCNAEAVNVYHTPIGDRYAEHRVVGRGGAIELLGFGAAVSVDAIFA
jgi:Uma2 family endonuclease